MKRVVGSKGAWLFTLSALVLLLVIGPGPASANPVPQLVLGVSLDGGTTFVANQTIGSDADTAFLLTLGSFPLYIGGQEGVTGGNYDALSNCGNANPALKGPCFGASISSPIIIASVPEGSSGSLTIGGVSPFLTSGTLGGDGGRLLSDHYPAQNGVSDFLFFNLAAALGLGSFTFGDANVADTSCGTVNCGYRNFQNLSDTGNGEEKNVSVAISGYSWVHFDIVGINDRGQLISNPNSSDVTVTVVPEPGTLLLLGTGLIGAAGFARRKWLARR